MASARLLITAAVGVRVARSLYARWRLLPEADRLRIESLAEDLKRRALDSRGADDREGARDDLHAASRSFAAALVETAEADPSIGDDEVSELRADLQRELERLAGADVKASRIRREPAPPPG